MYISSCSGQYIGTGVDIEVMLFEEDGHYVVEIAPTENAYSWAEENPDAEGALISTENDCERFGRKRVNTLESVNTIIREWLNDGQKFYHDELLGVIGC